MTRELPIIFSGPMVQALLDGRKTMTRRPIKPQPDEDGICKNLVDGLLYDTSGRIYKLPWQIGDHLWVKEAFAYCPLDFKDTKGYIYKADGKYNDYVCPGEWHNSMFMPRWATRITLEITDIKVERVQDISEEDARKEGCDFDDGEPPDGYGEEDRPTAKQNFMFLWDSIYHKKPAFDWPANPWVWVIEFKRITP